MGTNSGQILEFADGKDWYNVEGPPWLLNPHRGVQARLEYSLPMFPGSDPKSLNECAAGRYEKHWKTLAKHLVAGGLATSIIRPGWEFNTDWYPWSAIDRADIYAECFRDIVRAMRATRGERFTFDWNPMIGPANMNAEKAYPGNGYVDYVGVDIYDVNPAHYKKNLVTSEAAGTAWREFLTGDHGLQRWSWFAASHGKRLALTEWGVAHRADGTGGGDDAVFIDHIFDFITSDCRRIAYENYFNFGNRQDTHDLLATSYFARSKMRLRERLRSTTDCGGSNK